MRRKTPHGASQLLGDPIPPVSVIADLRAPGSGEAAPWIHRWALTALLFVVLPRALLFTSARLRAARMARELGPDLQSPYAVRLLAARRGEGFAVRILPYSTELSPQISERLRELAHTLFGNRALASIEAPVAYGAEPSPKAGRGATVVVFNLAQSPEQEVHGRFLEGLLRSSAGEESPVVLVALDETRYREVASTERIDERFRAWSRVLSAEGIEAVRLASETDADALLEAARSALGPALAEVRT